MKRTVILALLALSWVSYADDAGKKGQAIFSQHCSVCHLTGIANAPKAHDETAWQTRLEKALTTAKAKSPTLSDAQLHQKALEILIASVKKGLSAMPAGGMCPKCTDDDYQAAIEFMMHKQ